MSGKWTLLLATVILGNSTAWGGGVKCLREMGPQGLDVAIGEFHKAEAKLASAANAEEADATRAEMKRWSETADQVAAQRNAVASRLYWCTDLEHAKQVAAKLGRPILSLRLLGKLTDELSCANSRYFRTALYANEQISDALRERFVLHWQSERPVPKVTIDFGDGRKLERTVTGNSAHYVLTAEGKPLDVLPGLYSPKEFLAWLDRTEALEETYTAESGEKAREALLHNFHRDRLSEIHQAWQADAERVAPELLEGNNITLDVNDERWQLVAELHRAGAVLDESSVKLIRRQSPNPFEAGAISAAKRIVEDPILRLVRDFQDSIALDTVRNEFLLHREIHNWYARGEVSGDFDSLNERVYSELFLTPASDPWLGLAPSGAYTALENGGLGIRESR